MYHIVGADGTTPAVQCARLLAALPNDGTSCNVLNFIPTEVGYAGGAWNLQIFHWNAGITPVELSKDDDILAAVAAGEGNARGHRDPRPLPGDQLRGAALKDSEW